MAQTVLKDYGRAVRDEPLYYIYDHKIYLIRDQVPVAEVSEWLQHRYADAGEGNRYRVVSYKHEDGQNYVNYLLLESVTATDLLWIKLNWGWSRDPIVREGKKKRRRLTSSQREELNARIEELEQQFFDELDRQEKG